MKLRRSSPSIGLKSLSGKVIRGEKVNLREKKMSDVRNDYKWQSDTELAGLDAAPVLTMAFSVYLLGYSVEVHRKTAHRYPLAVETLEGKHIGNCTLYDVNIKIGEAQLGIMIGERDFWNRGYGTDAVTAMVDYAFQTANLKRIYLKTLDWNVRAQKCFAKCGFIPCGEMRRNSNNFILMELTREQWGKTR
jgi:RimJ/RimL family protein N-acetyltransferase